MVNRNVNGLCSIIKCSPYYYYELQSKEIIIN
jgi:hypothetical protein